MSEISISFALEAEQLLFAGYPDEALELSLKGVECFPDYPSAYIILAKSYKETGDTLAAVKIVDIALKKFPLNKLLVSLNNQFTSDIQEHLVSNKYDEIKEITQSEIESRDFNEIEDSESFEQEIETEVAVEEPVADESDVDVDIEELMLEQETEDLIEEANPALNSVLHLVPENNRKSRLELQAKNLSIIPGLDYTPLKIRTKKIFAFNHIKPLPEPPPFRILTRTESPVSETTIVSETMAKIYEQQRAFPEAIKAYEALIKQRPEKEDYYLSKIQALTM